jgi:hypothetical protein
LYPVESGLGIGVCFVQGVRGGQGYRGSDIADANRRRESGAGIATRHEFLS